MVKVISYRQKLLDLARIYKIDRVFDQNVKLTTYDIEIILLKKNVPLPSNKRGYLSHKFINEVLNPFYEIIKKKLSFSINISKFFKIFYHGLIKKLSINFNVSKFFKIFYDSVIRKKYINITKYLNKIFYGIENYFKFVISNIVNFFKILSKIIIDGLNDIYNFKVKEKIIENLFSRSIYA